MFKIQIKGITIETDNATAVLELIDKYGAPAKPEDPPVEITNKPRTVTKKAKSHTAEKKPGGTREAVLSAISSSGQTAASIANITGVRQETIYAMLAYLKNQGLVIKNPDGTWSKKR